MFYSIIIDNRKFIDINGKIVIDFYKQIYWQETNCRNVETNCVLCIWYKIHLILTLSIHYIYVK